MIISLFGELQRLKKENERLRSYHDGSLSNSLTRIGNMLGLKGKMYCEFGYSQIENEVDHLIRENNK